ncbi:hypothetical protein [Rhodococcus sp. SGAir0479]|uniref:hypothetical protein n=1 Tax=Rhodococcus sp. SGAir0479 TaxID=2567884 RepID=UPI0010CD43FF|nr:hypothetical protein [Rhodococcus sp. SGAir0479]QCQ92445.1 hypothetical protein E7742_15260 [Rhodococcus sp. SGAir0479]
MKIRHLVAVAAAPLILVAGCGDSDESTASAPANGQATADGSTAQDAAVSVMCAQVTAFLDSSQQQAESAGQPFDRQAKGDEFLETLKANGGPVVAAYNQQAEAAGQPPLDPATATWEDVPAEARDLIEQSVQAGVSGNC